MRPTGLQLLTVLPHVSARQRSRELSLRGSAVAQGKLALSEPARRAVTAPDQQSTRQEVVQWLASSRSSLAYSSYVPLDLQYSAKAVAATGVSRGELAVITTMNMVGRSAGRTPCDEALGMAPPAASTMDGEVGTQSLQLAALEGAATAAKNEGPRSPRTPRTPRRILPALCAHPPQPFAHDLAPCEQLVGSALQDPMARCSEVSRVGTNYSRYPMGRGVGRRGHAARSGQRGFSSSRDRAAVSCRFQSGGRERGEGLGCLLTRDAQESTAPATLLEAPETSPLEHSLPTTPFPKDCHPKAPTEPMLKQTSMVQPSDQLSDQPSERHEVRDLTPSEGRDPQPEEECDCRRSGGDRNASEDASMTTSMQFVVEGLGAEAEGDDAESMVTGSASFSHSLAMDSHASDGRAAEVQQRVVVVAALKASDYFRGLRDSELHAIARTGTERRAPRYSAIFMERTAARSFYVLLEGKLQLSSIAGGHRQATQRAYPTPNEPHAYPTPNGSSSSSTSVSVQATGTFLSQAIAPLMLCALGRRRSLAACIALAQ